MTRFALLLILVTGFRGLAWAQVPDPRQADAAAAIIKRAEAAGMRVNCADWKQEADGTWSSDARGTIFYPNHIGDMGDNRGFSHSTMVWNGISVGDYIAAKCTPLGPPSTQL